MSKNDLHITQVGPWTTFKYINAVINNHKQPIVVVKLNWTLSNYYSFFKVTAVGDKGEIFFR